MLAELAPMAIDDSNPDAIVGAIVSDVEDREVRRLPGRGAIM